MSIIRLAWRNLWRNPRRAAITVAAVAANTAILIATYSLMDGLMIHTVKNATNLVTGEVQIHVPKYLSRRSFYQIIENPDAVLKKLREQNIPAAARSYGFGLTAAVTKSSGALFWGVDPKAEAATFDLAQNLAQGKFLPDTPQKGLVLGRKLAKSLDIAPGSEVVVVAQAADGSLGNELFTVTGILKAAGDTIDRNAAIMHHADFSELFVSKGMVHEIAANTKGKFPLAQVKAYAIDAAAGMEVMTWRQLLPALSDMVNIMDGAMAIFSMVFFLAGGLGVMNTMLMATFERTREFGIIKALGATPWLIVRDVAAEACVLGIFASAVGVVVGLAGSLYLQAVGIDTSVFSGDFSMAGIAMDPLWLAVVSPKAVIFPALIMSVICVAASLYPAVLASRLNPIKAITHI